MMKVSTCLKGLICTIALVFSMQVSAQMCPDGLAPSISGLPIPGIDQVCPGDVFALTGDFGAVPPAGVTWTGSFSTDPQSAISNTGPDAATFVAPGSGAVVTFDIVYSVLSGGVMLPDGTLSGGVVVCEITESILVEEVCDPVSGDVDETTEIDLDLDGIVDLIQVIFTIFGFDIGETWTLGEFTGLVDANGDPIMGPVTLVDNGDGTYTYVGYVPAGEDYDADFVYYSHIVNLSGSTNAGGCIAEGGVLAGNAFACEGEFVVANSVGATGDILYCLHNSGTDPESSCLAVSTSGVFFNDGTAPTNVQLSISAIATDPVSGCTDVSNELPVVFFDPIVINTVETCDPVTGDYMVEFSISGGGPSFLPNVHTYDVTGTFVGDVEPGTTYTFGPVASGAPYTISVIEDGKGCSETYNGIEVCTPVSTCNNVAGVMPQALQAACSGAVVNSPVIGAVPDVGSVISYVIHDGATTLGTPYGTSANGVFVNNGSIPTNIQLYVSAVVGAPDAAGLADLNDVCTEVALPGTPVRFYDPIVITHEYICNDVTGEYVVMFSITGGGPSFPTSNHVYDVAGVYNGTVMPNQTITTAPQTDGSSYTISITDDGKGCTTSITSDEVQCEKLPVELVSFDGTVREEGNYLNWITASEVDNDFFTLEISVDGGNEFSYLATIDASGNTNTMSNYDFLDSNAPNGEVFYKLIQTDFDGTTEEIGIVRLVREIENFEVSNIYPNPVNELLNIGINAVSDKEVEISIYDALSRKVYSEMLQINSGLNTHTINVNDFIGGVYILNITSESDVKTQKFTVE